MITESIESETRMSTLPEGSLLEGKSALVAGGGRGIGRAVAIALARNGARVVVNDYGCEFDGSSPSNGPADAVVGEIVEAGGTAVASYANVASNSGAQSAVQTAIDAFGDLDVLVFSAGIVRDVTILKMEESDWDSVLGVALKGAFLTIRATARHMVSSRHGGRMVIMTGLPGYLGSFAQANVAAACGGIHGLLRTAAIELQKHKITVNGIAPLAKTRLTESLPLLNGFDNLTPEHVTPAVLALSSDLCGNRTGFVLAVTGARTYSFRFVESPGKFKDTEDGLFTPEEIDENWHAIVKA